MHDFSYQPKRHIAIIESARGFAALYVIISHIVEILHLPTMFPANSAITLVVDLLMIYGDQAVLLFFVLSGFSIHYASADRELSNRHGLLNYYYLRWRRIYPIFIVALLLGYIADLIASSLAPSRYGPLMQDFKLDELLFTLTFMTDRPYVDGMIMPVIKGNTPLWSLSYEIFYYLIYPAYWYANRRWGFVNAAAGGLAVSLLAFGLGKIFGANHFLNVLNHYVLWCLGAALADMHRRDIKITVPMVLHAPFIYVLLQSAWVLENATYTVGAIFDITWGLFFFSVMLLFLRNDQPQQMSLRHKRHAVIIATLGYCAIIATVRQLDFVPNLLLFYWHITLTFLAFIMGLYVASLSIDNLSRRLLAPLYRFGASSYGLYILHYPVLLIVMATLVHYHLSGYFCLLSLPLIILMARLIEIRFQPFAVSHLDIYARKLGLLNIPKITPAV